MKSVGTQEQIKKDAFLNTPDVKSSVFVSSMKQAVKACVGWDVEIQIPCSLHPDCWKDEIKQTVYTVWRRRKGFYPLENVKRLQKFTPLVIHSMCDGITRDF